MSHHAAAATTAAVFDVSVACVRVCLSVCAVIRCRQLVDPDHGLIRCDAGTLYGSRCELQCRRGYAVVGQPTAVCLDHGRWTHDSPLCAGLHADLSTGARGEAVA